MHSASVTINGALTPGTTCSNPTAVTPSSAETPSRPGQRQRPAADLLEIELHPGHEQRDRHGEHEHRRDEAVEAHQAQHVRTDDDAEQHLQHDDRHVEAGGTAQGAAPAPRPTISQKTGCPIGMGLSEPFSGSTGLGVESRTVLRRAASACAVPIQPWRWRVCVRESVSCNCQSAPHAVQNSQPSRRIIAAA